QIARIAQDGEIGPAAYFVDGVDRFICPLLESGGRRQREMAARREADHPDPLRVDSPFRGAAADEADGPLGVEQRAQGRLASDITRTPRHTVLEDDAGHAARVQPRRHFLSLELPIKIPVPAPR